MKVYKADLSGSKGRIVPAVWLLVMFITTAFVYTFMVFPRFVKENPDQTSQLLWLMGGMYALHLILGVGIVIPLFLERKTASFRVRLKDDEVEAFKIDGSKTAIRFADIVSIIAVKNPWFALFAKNIRVSDKDENSIFIHYNIRRLGECVESIRKEAVNCETVNYAGLEKSIYWNRE